jgi:hypothetical protein
MIRLRRVAQNHWYCSVDRLNVYFFLLQGPVAWRPERTVLIRNQVGDCDDHHGNFNRRIPLGENDREDAADWHFESSGQLPKSLPSIPPLVAVRSDIIRHGAPGPNLDPIRG